MKNYDDVSPPQPPSTRFAAHESSFPTEAKGYEYLKAFDTEKMKEAKGPWVNDILSMEFPDSANGLRWPESRGLHRDRTLRSRRQFHDLARRMQFALRELQHTVDIDPERQYAIPVLAGTRFRISQLFGEIADSDAIEEVATDLDLDLEAVRRLVHAMAILFDKPAYPPCRVHYD